MIYEDVTPKLHLTHRCHKKEFLLKFARDRRRWLQWLFEAKKRYGIRVLNYIVTSNHVHLLVQDGKNRSTIPKTIVFLTVLILPMKMRM